MWDVRACRVCLATDVHLNPLLNNRLEQHFTVLTGEDVRVAESLPLYLCGECTALVHKYYGFRQRCLRGQMALQDLLRTHDEVTLHQIRQVDRGVCGLASPYTTHHTPAELFVQHYLYHADPGYNEVEVKEEEPGDEPVPELEVELGGGVKEEVTSEVDEYKGYLSSIAFTSDEDDEPLALRRVRLSAAPAHLAPPAATQPAAAAPPPPPAAAAAAPAAKKRRGRRRKVVLDEEADVKPLIVPKVRRRRSADAGGTERVLKKRGPKPGARGRDEAAMEEYVTIVRLSPEEQLQEILGRRDSANYLNAPFKCDVCYKGFVDTDAFRNHVVKHEPSAGDIECPICKFRFQTRRTLQKHAANHEKKYQCKACPYISKTTTQAKQHQKWHKGITYKCQYCEEVSTKWTSYLSHVRIKHPSEHICNVCGYSFVSKLGLAMHKTMMHKDVQERKVEAPPAAAEGGGAEAAGVGVGVGDAAAPYCGECGVQFTSRQAWKRHMVTSAKHSQTTDFGNGCRVCGETFPSAEELRLHHRKMHARKRPKNYGKKPSDIVWPINCEHCDEEIPNAREYWTHFRRVHPDKKYPIKKAFVCEICGKEFRGNAFLVYHKRTHSEERTYTCKQCPKSFFNRTNLMMHEKTHSDHRPYPCGVCFKAFKLKGALDRHFRSHTGVKPYECEFCGKAFGQSNSRKLHVRTVHLKQPAPYISRSRLERRRHADAAKTHPAFPY